MLLQGFQVLDEISSLGGRQAELHERIVVIHHVLQGGEATVVMEATLVDLLAVPERPQGRRPVRSIRGAIGLKGVDADLLRLVNRVS
jgi:hypothetical protein